MTHKLWWNDILLGEIETGNGDLSSLVCIDGYSKFLLTNLDKKDEIISDFYFLQEIRCEYWENPKQTETPRELAARRYIEIGKKYGLGYSTD